jgi:hypothetical protein
LKVSHAAIESKNRFRRKRSGVSTVIGTLIFVLIVLVAMTTITTIFGYYSTYNSDLLQYDQTVQHEDQTSLSFSGLTFGAGADTVATSTSSWYTYVPITLTNSQTSATPATFQQKITFDPATYSTLESPTLGNIRFCSTTTCTSELYAWLESCTPSCSPTATSASVWVKLTSAINANGGTATIYMVFEPASVTTFDGNYWGESPTLSSTYGQYDNGANVFTFYDNFAGTTLNANKWTSFKSATGATLSVDNGLTVTTTSDSGYALVMSPFETEPQVAEAYIESPGAPVLGVATTQNLDGTYVLPYAGYAFGWYGGYEYTGYVPPAGNAEILNTYQETTFPQGIWQVTWYATASQYYVDGAGNAYPGSNSGASIANYGIFIGMTSAVAGTSIFDWARMRAFPPNNVMPSVSFGSKSGSGSSTGTSYSSQRKLIYSQGLWWAFYSDGANIGYSTSPDGSTWSAETIITSSTDSTDGFNFDIWVSGSTLYYVLGAMEQSSSFLWRYGTLQSSGAISWTIAQTSVTTTNKVDSFDSIVTDSSGNVWVALNTFDGTNTHVEVWKYSSGAWAKEDDISPVASDIVPLLVPLANGIALIYGEGSVTSQLKVITTTTGASWSTSVSPPSDYAMFYSSATSIGNTLYFAGLASSSTGQTSGTLNFWSYAYGSSATSVETVLQSSSAAWVASISEDPSDTLIAFFGSGTTLSMMYSTNYGSAWSSAVTISSSETSITGVSSTFTGSGVLWTSGSSSPFNVRFAAIPLIAATNKSPFAVHLISLYIYDTATQTLVHFDTNSLATGVTGSFDFELSPGEELSMPLSSFTWTDDQSYLITMTTDQGVLISSALTSPA